jgi:hypothetical protein
VHLLVYDIQWIKMHGVTIKIISIVVSRAIDWDKNQRPPESEGNTLSHSSVMSVAGDMTYTNKHEQFSWNEPRRFINIHEHWKVSSFSYWKVMDFTPVLKFLSPTSLSFLNTQRFVQFIIHFHGYWPLTASLPPPPHLLTGITHFHCPEVVTVCSVAPVSEKWLLKKTLVSSTVIVWPVQSVRDQAIHQNIENNLRHRIS